MYVNVCMYLRVSKYYGGILNSGFSKFKSPFPLSGLEPSPAPDSGDGVVSHSTLSPSLTASPAPDSSFFKFSPPSPPLDGFPAPENGRGGAEGENPSDVAPSPAPTEETGSDAVTWCAVRDGEFDDCENFVSVFKQSEGYTWKW